MKFLIPILLALSGCSLPRYGLAMVAVAADAAVICTGCSDARVPEYDAGVVTDSSVEPDAGSPDSSVELDAGSPDAGRVITPCPRSTVDGFAGTFIEDPETHDCFWFDGVGPYSEGLADFRDEAETTRISAAVCETYSCTGQLWRVTTRPEDAVMCTLWNPYNTEIPHVGPGTFQANTCSGSFRRLGMLRAEER